MILLTPPGMISIWQLRHFFLATFVISFHKFSDTLFGEIPTFMCGDTDDKVGDCTHTTALSVLLTESCFCEGELCNSVNATFPKEKAMNGAGSVPPAAAIAAATVVAIAASIY